MLSLFPCSDSGPSRISLPPDLVSRTIRPNKRRPRRLLSVLNDFDGDEAADDGLSSSEILRPGAWDTARGDQAHTSLYKPSVAALQRRRSMSGQHSVSETGRVRRSEPRFQSEEPAPRRHGRDLPLAATPLALGTMSDSGDRRSGDIKRRLSRAVGDTAEEPLSLRNAESGEARQHNKLAEIHAQRETLDRLPPETIVENADVRLQIDAPPRKTRQGSDPASQFTQQELPDSSRRRGRKRQPDEERRKSPEAVISSKRRTCEKAEYRASKSKSLHVALEDSQQFPGNSTWGSHNGTTRSRRNGDGGSPSFGVLREIENNGRRTQECSVPRHETDLEGFLPAKEPLLFGDSWESSRLKDTSVDLLERYTRPSRSDTDGITCLPAQSAIAEAVGGNAQVALLQDLHAISQESHGKSLWECSESEVRLTDLECAPSTGTATLAAPRSDWRRRSDETAQHAIESAMSLTPPSAAMTTPSSWVYCDPVGSDRQDPHYLHSTNDRPAATVKELSELPTPVTLRGTEKHIEPSVTPEAATPRMLYHPCGESESRREPPPETRSQFSLTHESEPGADEAKSLAALQTAAHRESAPAAHVLWQGAQEGCAGLRPELPLSATAKADSDPALGSSQDYASDGTRAIVSHLPQRHAGAAGSREDDCSGNQHTCDGSARVGQSNELLLEGLDEIDIANLELTPAAAQLNTSTSPQRISDFPATNRAFPRTCSPQGRTDSFDDLAEDNGFWNEVFDDDMRPYDTTAISEADEWTGLETLSDMESAATAAWGPPPMPCSPPPGAHLGFSTAANKKLVQPSEAAVARVMQRLGHLASSEEVSEKDVQSMGVALPARRAAQSASSSALQTPPSPAAMCPEVDCSALDSSEEDQESHEAGPAASHTISANVFFKKANGLSLQVNAAALEAAKRRMAVWEAEHCQQKDTLSGSAVRTNMESRQTFGNGHVARGTPVPPRCRTGSSVAETEPLLTKLPACPSPNLCDELASDTPGQDQEIRGDTMISKGLDFDAAGVDVSPGSLPLTPCEAVQTHVQVHQLVTPIRPAANRFNGSLMIAGREASTPNRPTPTRLDGRTSRISLGMTPRANFTPKAAGRPTFKTPFKNGVVAASPSIMPGSVSPRAVLVQSRTYPQDLSRFPRKGAGGILDPTRSDPTVFNLEAIVPRLSLKQYRMLPSAIRQAASEEIPHEIMTIINEPQKSFCWVFNGPTGEECGVKTALEELRKAGASRVDLAWVSNHWTMILWKLACYTRSKPQEAAIWWCFEQVMRQLKYRYEREINLAQRSAIKRIQERDSSPGLPIILRVFGHHRTNPKDGLGEHGKVKDKASGGYDYELELTDGWYRMRARMDRTLSRAFKRGRIPQGMKLAIQGAKLASNSTDGNDVLAASGISHLVLSGNGTSPAPWDSRMGFQKHTFSASLRSLTAEGGLVPSMEVTITRLFPVAFVDANGLSTQQTGSARGAAEEADAQRAWETRRDDFRSRFEDEMEHDLKLINAVRELLAASVGCESGSSANHEDEEDIGAERGSTPTADYESLADDALEDLLSSDRPSSTLANCLRSIPSKRHRYFLCCLSCRASARYERMQSDAQAHLEHELNKTCPLRKVRSFRVCRFVDAREGERRKPCNRTVQLTVWDLGDMDQDTLEEGATYKVTNLIPTQRSSWRSCKVAADAFLATRRDSTWKRLR